VTRNPFNDVLPGHVRGRFRLTWPFVALIGLVLVIVLTSVALAFDVPVGFVAPVVIVVTVGLMRAFGSKD
jgi:hypothetical protein